MIRKSKTSIVELDYSSLQIFELFQGFHKYKDAPSDLSLFIAQLWPWVPISYDEMSDLISLPRDCIGQITAEDHLLKILVGAGSFIYGRNCSRN